MPGQDRAIRRRQAANKAQAARRQAARQAQSRSWTTGSIALGAIALAITAAIAGLLIAAVRGDSHAPVSASAVRKQTEDQVGALLKGIPQNGNTLGEATAPVTLQIFADLECLTVKNFVLRLLPAIIQEFVRSGTVRIEYRSLKTDTHARKAFVTQQAAAIAAGGQEKMWNFVETFYHEQGIEYTGYATENYLHGIAGQVPGLDLSRWIRDRENFALREQVLADDRAARAVGLHTTPSFAIGRTGGKMKKLTGRTIVIYPNEKNPVGLIDAQELGKAIEHLP